MRLRTLLAILVAAAVAGCGKSSINTGASTGAASTSENAVLLSAERRVPAPSIALSDLNGRKVSTEELKGKPYIVDFWATWCPPCRQEIPHLKELYATYHPKGLEILGITSAEPLPVVKAFAKDNNLPWPILVGNEATGRQFGGIVYLPTAFLIDGKGRIAQKYVGYTDKKTFEAGIKAVLAEGPSRSARPSQEPGKPRKA